MAASASWQEAHPTCPCDGVCLNQMAASSLARTETRSIESNYGVEPKRLRAASHLDGCVCVWVKTMSSIITQIRYSRHNMRDAATRLGRGVTGNGRTCGKNTKSADLLHRTCVRGAGEREGEGERAAGWAGVGGGKRMLESRPTHSRITPESLPTHSRITPESFPNHSRLTPDSLPTHSQLTPVIFHKIGDLGVCAC